MNFRVGTGYDVHVLTEGRKLILGGVLIEHKTGLLGHSNADVLIHAIMDALLGAAALGDIGKHFPDSSDKYKNIDSRVLLREVCGILKNHGFSVNNIDATIVAQKPKLSPYILKMRENISGDLNIDISQVSIKATTTEGLGFEGEEKGISAQAVCSLC